MLESSAGWFRSRPRCGRGRVAEMDRRSEEAHARPREQFVEAVETALEKTLDAHAQRGWPPWRAKTTEQTARLMQHMAVLAAAVRDTGREQQASLARVAEGVADPGRRCSAGLQEGETNLVHLQAVLHQNLAALASASNFEQAVHSLTAAVHLLTARAAAAAVRSPAAAPARTGEGRMRTRRHKLQVSTFPFLAVLLVRDGGVAAGAARDGPAGARRRPRPDASRPPAALVEEAANDAEARRAVIEEQRQETRAARQRERDADHAPPCRARTRTCKNEIQSVRDETRPAPPSGCAPSRTTRRP